LEIAEESGKTNWKARMKTSEDLSSRYGDRNTQDMLEKNWLLCWEMESHKYDP